MWVLGLTGSILIQIRPQNKLESSWNLPLPQPSLWQLPRQYFKSFFHFSVFVFENNYWKKNYSHNSPEMLISDYFFGTSAFAQLLYLKMSLFLPSQMLLYLSARKCIICSRKLQVGSRPLVFDSKSVVVQQLPSVLRLVWGKELLLLSFRTFFCPPAHVLLWCVVPFFQFAWISDRTF